MVHKEKDDAGLWLVDLPPSRRQDRAAIAVATIVLVGFAIAAPFATQPLVELNAFFPSLDAIVFVTGLITAALLFAQFSINRSRALLALAIGYLFTALIVVPHALTFAGAYSATGLLSAGIQTGSYLFIFWHVGFGLALSTYAIIRRGAKPVVSGSPTYTVAVSAAGVTALVCCLTWLATVGEDLLPRIVLDQTHISSMVIYPISFALLVFAFANVILAYGRRSVLDQWLMVVILASILELVFSGLIPSVRFSLGFYAGRVLSVITSSIVLIVMLAETTWLYMRLAATNVMLRRERQNKLMNFEAMTASIAHEVRGPLGAIAVNGETAVLVLAQTPPDVAEASLIVKDMVADSHRASETFNNLRTLFGTADDARQHVDVNDVVIDVLKASRSDCDRYGIKSVGELASERPFLYGHKGQLRELVNNLVQNAVEAMTGVDEYRLLKVQTGLLAGNVVLISIQDTGPGISREEAKTIFDAFVTTKSHGRGLGLAICRMIVERHNGQLSVSSAEPRGTIFQIKLPSSG
jgi:signal transduction histidine kinase